MGAAIPLSPEPHLAGVPLHATDGVLQAWEVAADIPSDAALVVLSGCQTAVGDESLGEGVASLQQAFVQGGSRNVLAALWDVDDDATCGFMVAFHRAVQTGIPGEDALMRAVDAVRRQARYCHPYYWAAFRDLQAFSSLR
jgi:CHAT domain-containing protein